MRFDFESGCTLQHVFELFDDFPLWFPMFFFLIVEEFDLFSLANLCLCVFSELLYFSLNFDPVNIYLVLQPIKLIVPASRYIFLLYYTLECILPEFVIGWFVLETL